MNKSFAKKINTLFVPFLLLFLLQEEPLEIEIVPMEHDFPNKLHEQGQAGMDLVITVPRN